MSTTLPANMFGIARLVRTVTGGSGEKHIGMGFIIDPRHVMTCCHVVNNALDRKDSFESAPPPPESRFALRFPFPNNAPGVAKVVTWGLNEPWPVDIAVLELEQVAPPSSRVARFADAEVRCEKWTCIGWDADGVERATQGEVAAQLSRGELQLNGATGIAARIAGGYSGTPVWSDRLRSFIGMVVTRDRDQFDNGLAYAIPATALSKLWPRMKVTSKTRDGIRAWLFSGALSAALMVAVALISWKLLSQGDDTSAKPTDTSSKAQAAATKPTEKQTAPERSKAQDVPTMLPRTRMRVGMWKWVGYSSLKVAESMEVNDGLELEIRDVKNIKDARQWLANDLIDASVCIVDAHVQTRAGGGTSKVVLKLDESLGADAVVARESIGTFAELKGRKVAYAASDAPQYLFFALCVIHQLSPTDVTMVPADAEEAADMFIRGEVDAAVTYHPYLNRALMEGHNMGNEKAHVLGHSATPSVSGTIVDVLHVNENFLKENRPVVTALINRWINAVNQLKGGNAASTKIAYKWLGVPPEEYDLLAKGMKYSDLKDNYDFFRVTNGSSRFRELMGKAEKRLKAFGALAGETAVDAGDADASEILFEINR